MRQWWKFATLATSICAVVMMVVMICGTIILTSNGGSATEAPPLRIPTSGIVQRTPNHVLASVILMNGDLQGSGTIISKGPKKAALLTTAHNFKGNIGGKFWIYYVDGTYTEATLLAIDRSRDLAIASVDSSTILTHAYVPSALLKEGDLTGCGFTNGRGPIFKTLAYQRQFRESNGRIIWQMRVKSGTFSSGDSGGGVFQGDALIGVPNSRNYCGSNSLYACPHHEIVKFLNEHSSVLAGCGSWSVAPEGQYGATNADAPPLWKPTPNVPIVLPGLAGTRRPSDVRDPEQAIPPAAPLPKVLKK